MNKNTPKILTSLIIFVTFFYSFHAIADISSNDINSTKSLWNELSANAQKEKIFAAKLVEPLNARVLALDELSLKSKLNKSISSNKAAKLQQSSNNTEPSVNLPLPDGSSIEVTIQATQVMSEKLAQQFPEIKTWSISNKDKNITGSMEFTTRGFQAMLMMPDGDQVFISPETAHTSSTQSAISSQARYISFSKKENKANFKQEFSCGVHDKKLNFSTAAKGSLLAERLSARPAPNLVTYRLAVAATGEYTQFHGGTISSAMSAIVTTISRVNQIYKRDLGVAFQLIDEESEIIYLNPNTDPYSNSQIDLLISQNNANLSSSGVLSKSKYDVGHVFDAGDAGGLAFVGGVCDDDEKAKGATSIPSPIGDGFDFDFVAHELGHQLGADHTFNSICNGGRQRIAETAVEPGSGSTIMAYPGICAPNNIQNSVDQQFHVVSIDQIRGVTRTGGGSSCGVRSSTSNENPTVNAGNDVTVPARTPLVLIATGADADNDDLSYTWEQSDAGIASSLNVDTGDNALFRSRPATASGTRFIPRLANLFSGNASPGEALPITNRDINMVATVRDGKGGLQADLVKLTVFDSGDSFRITSHTNTQSFGREESTELRWNVAGTNVSPISCANVDIGLITANEQGIDIVTTANDGREIITIPDNAPVMNNARFILSCSNNNFFNVSLGRLTILDQVGGGSSGGGGGSFGLLTLSLMSLVCYRRKIKSVAKF